MLTILHLLLLTATVVHHYVSNVTRYTLVFELCGLIFVCLYANLFVCLSLKTAHIRSPNTIYINNIVFLIIHYTTCFDVYNFVLFTLCRMYCAVSNQ